MSWAAIGAAVVGLIAALPKLLGYLDQFIAWIKDLEEKAGQEKLDSDVKKAEDHAKDTKDTSALEDVFRGPPSSGA